MESWVYKQGEQKGVDKGRAELLLEQLAAKFGQVPADVEERVKSASREEVRAWATRVLTAATLSEALVPPDTATPA